MINVAQAAIFGRQKKAPNTFIGGIAKTGGTGVNEPIDTIAKLATKLGISENRFSSFKITGDDVSVYIGGGTYGILNSNFRYNTNIISYIDNGKLIDSLSEWSFSESSIKEFYSESESSGSITRAFEPCLSLTDFNWEAFKGEFINYNFRNCNITGIFKSDLNSMRNNNFESAKFSQYILNELTKIGYATSSTLGFNFSYNTNVTLISMKKLKSFGLDSSVNKNNFFNIKTGCLIQVNVFLSTINAGNAAADLVYAKNNRGAIVEFYDDAGNYVSTL